MKREDAEEFSQSLGQIAGGTWRQILWAKKNGVPKALGLALDEWVVKYIGGYYRQPVEERREASKELTAPVEEGGEGLTQREAADVLGVDQKTVSNDLRAEENSSTTATGQRKRREPKENSSTNKGGSQKRYTKPDESTMKFISAIVKYPPRYVGGSIVVADREYAQLLVKEIEGALSQ